MAEGASVDPAEARKRRKAIITQRQEEGESSSHQSGENEHDESDSSKKRKNDGGESKSRKKTQIRYDPDVEMSKEQLAAWRREARRVRNRESAAASRQRIRSRITELETEVEDWKGKYADAVDRLQRLQEVAASQPVGEASATGGEANI